MIKPKNRRNRASKPSWSWSGMNSATWRSDPSNVTWAQLDSRFKDLMTVMVNERTRITGVIDYGTESRKLGRVEGYQIALDVMNELSVMIPPPKPIEEEPTYPVDNDAPDLTYIES